MKKMTLLLAMMLIGLTSATATDTSKSKRSARFGDLDQNRFTQPIMFIERGVEFLIFPDGQFDFNTETNYTTSSLYRRSNSRRGSINATYGAPGTHINYTRPRGTLITHDSRGRVRRIGNVFINYDSRDRVKRIGSVYMRYRRGLLKQVGGLHIQYNHYGDMIGFNGFVNFNNQTCNIWDNTNYFGNHHDVWSNDWDDDWFDDEEFYYYRKGNKVKKKKKKNKF